MRAGPDQTLLPDPFAAVVSPMPNAQQRSFHRQHQRRAGILAATRRTIAEGPEHFTLKRVARDCTVTVQTVRNSFGRREELMISAINEHTSIVWGVLGGIASGPTLFLHLADLYYQRACATPDFLKGMVTMALANAHSLPALMRHGTQIKVEHLRAMAREDWFRPAADLEVLAAQITRLNTFMMFEWASSGDAEELRRQMIEGNRLLMLGAVRPHAVAALEAWTPRLS